MSKSNPPWIPKVNEEFFAVLRPFNGRWIVWLDRRSIIHKDVLFRDLWSAMPATVENAYEGSSR